MTGTNIELAGNTTPDIYRPPSATFRPVEVPPLKSQLRGTFWLGFAFVLLFFGLGGGWAATAPMAGATITAGYVSPEGSRRTVQHLEGGIIREFKVKEGDEVNAGDPLVILSGVGAQADVGALTSRLRTLSASEARLMAERTGATEIKFTHPSLAQTNDPEVRSIINQQINQFQTRKFSDDNRTAILVQRIAELEQQNIGAQKQIDSVRRQVALIREEIVAKKELYEKGFEAKPKLLALQRAEADLVGQEGDLMSRIARNNEAIGETKLQINDTRVQRMEDVDKELTQVQAQRIETEQRIKESADRLARTTIVAPISGMVMDMRYKTVGAVIRPGEPVLDLVPTQEKLLIDVRISTKDIDDVRAGLPAYVIFPSYPQRTMIRVPGKVETVSADALVDQHSGEHYYSGKIRIDTKKMKELDPSIELTPGMPAEAYIATIERTFLEYLLQPYMFLIERGLREH